MTMAQLADRLSLAEQELIDQLQGAPKQTLLAGIAKQLAVPDFVFLMRETPHLEAPIVDFRRAHPAALPKQSQTIEAIQLARAVQKTAQLHGVKGVKSLPQLAAQLSSVEEAAERARRYFHISIQDQAQARDARTFYSICRRAIEERGVFVLHESFPPEDGSGFCLSDPSHPVIVVNTAGQSRGRRLFTLVHELAHVLIGQSGISDPHINLNNVERLCNRFAGAFLVPAKAVETLLGARPAPAPSLDDVRWASRKLKISQEAAVVRLEQLGFYNDGTYARVRAHWASIGLPDTSDRGGGANGPPAQEKVKLAKYGFRLASVLADLSQRNEISGLDIYRMCGLKPKYQSAYFDYAKALARVDAGALEDLDA